jgi:hypothetical protein
MDCYPGSSYGVVKLDRGQKCGRAQVDVVLLQGLRHGAAMRAGATRTVADRP